MTEYINVDVKGLSDIFKELSKLGSVIQKKAAIDMTRVAANEMRKALRKNTPVVTGTLKKSIRNIRIYRSETDRITYQIGFGKKGWYARLVEFGVQPHLIPKSGKASPMRIGQNVFTGPIQHPGFQPRRFVTRTFEENYDNAIKAGESAFKAALTKYKK
jgi:HK97 gp10 family phage protein